MAVLRPGRRSGRQPVQRIYLIHTGRFFRCFWQAALEGAIFGSGSGLVGAVGGDPRDAAVLISGLRGDAMAALTRRLTGEGVARERVLFCDFF